VSGSTDSNDRISSRKSAGLKEEKHRVADRFCREALDWLTEGRLTHLTDPTGDGTVAVLSQHRARAAAHVPCIKRN
jgi:hypothetical protein